MKARALPAIYVHAEPANHSGKVPAMVFFDGLDVTKEIQYFKGVPDLVARGIACLIVDGPGNGESIRFRNLYLHHETERYAHRRRTNTSPRARKSMPSASASWRSASAATTRRAPPPSSSALPAASPGARSGTTEKIWREPLRAPGSAQNCRRCRSRAQHICCGCSTSTSQEEALKRLEAFKLDGVVQKITCPFLMLHGEGDEQIPLAEAQKCFDAVGSKQKTFKLFTREEGGYHHCQIDNQSICSRLYVGLARAGAAAGALEYPSSGPALHGRSYGIGNDR